MDATTQCPSCAASRQSIVRDGHFFRADDAKAVQRYRCKACGKKFSAATLKPTYRQKKRRINSTIRCCFASKMCPRDMAELVGVNIKTVASRLRWQAALSRRKNREYLRAYLDVQGPIKCVLLGTLPSGDSVITSPTHLEQFLTDTQSKPVVGSSTIAVICSDSD